MPIRNPLRVAFDIHRLSAGGLNGGIKVHLYEFIRQLSHFPDEISLLILCHEPIIEELDFVAENVENEIHVIGSYAPEKRRDHIEKHPHFRYWPAPPQDLLKAIAADVLYCGFVYSQFSDPDIPQISLIVDCLHRDHPEFLPDGEVEYREKKNLECIQQATLIQTNSRFCIERLQTHYDIPSEKLFPIYLPLHGRFNDIDLGKIPSALEAQDYFLYPANHWPHKNHERLLEAYKIYTQKVDTPKKLALTGHPSERQTQLEEKRDELEISKHVLFLEHTGDSDFKAIWENAYALIFPSLYEGFGLPILEAMHFQKPIAASKVASIPEIGQDLIDYFDPLDADSIADSLIKLHNLDTSETNYAAHYRERLTRFNLESEAKKLLDQILRAGRNAS